MGHFKNVQQENIDSQLGQDSDQCESEVIIQVALSNLVRLSNFGFVRKLNNH